ncbi:hypothetical protein [Hoeflea sp. TYP-13]|uniref:N-acyl amino acid synthase FeeM domain-containing protein n=1 Tax=Hoeflea sp. TYP-13 TaxID=3230023 RepID=UPI0034C6A3B9
MTPTNGMSSFNSKLFDVMDRIEYRRIISAEDFEDVSSLRSKAYKRAKMHVPSNNGLFVDDADFDPQAYVFGIYCDEQLISTLRIHHVTPDHRDCPSRNLFPKEVDAFLDAGMTLIDPVRHASDPDVFDDLPSLPYLTLRIATMAIEYFDADRCLSFVPPRHTAFYRRVFGSKQVAGPLLNCKGYDIDFSLLAADVPNELPKVYRRYPFFRSQPFEQRMMFASPDELGTMPLTIRPTARYLQAA